MVGAAPKENDGVLVCPKAENAEGAAEVAAGVDVLVALGVVDACDDAPKAGFPKPENADVAGVDAGAVDAPGLEASPKAGFPKLLKADGAAAAGADVFEAAVVVGLPNEGLPKPLKAEGAGELVTVGLEVAGAVEAPKAGFPKPANAEEAGAAVDVVVVLAAGDAVVG